MSWAAWKLTSMPSTAGVLVRRRAITCWAVSVRWSKGFRVTQMRPLLPVWPPSPAPMLEERAATAGSLATTSAMAIWRRAISAKETSWPALVVPIRTPLSWLGKKPLGIWI